MRRSAVLLNQSAISTGSKLAAYPLLMDKRRTKVFVKLEMDERDEIDQSLKTAFENLQASVKQQSVQYGKALKEVAEQQKKYNKPASLIDKLFHLKEKQQEELKRLKKDAEVLAAESYIDI